MKYSLANEFEKKLLEMYIGDLIGLKTIGKRISKDPRTFKYLITKFGFEIPNPGSFWIKIKYHLDYKFYRPISPFLHELIIGSLLGDAQIRLQSKNVVHSNNPDIIQYQDVLQDMNNFRNQIRKSNELGQNEVDCWNEGIKMIQNTNTATLRFHKSILEKNWVRILSNQLSPAYSATPYVKLKGKRNINQRIKWTCGFDTSASVQLFKIWQLWYIQKGTTNIKVLPRNLPEITPNILLHWYIGDGTLSGSDFSLSTHNFTYLENLKLRDYLSTVGITSSVKQKNNNYFLRLSNSQSNVETFFNYISKAKLYNNAKDLFPYKFDKKIKKGDWINKVLKEYPEFTDENSIIKFD